ncbi:substrate-binding domain-containing protein [Escherichia coli]
MTTVTADNILEGKLIGDWRKKSEWQSCNVVELQGTVGASVAIDRKKGFAEAIKNAPNIKIIRLDSQVTSPAVKAKKSWRALSKRKTTANNICMVYAHNDDMVIGAIQAIKEAGLKPGKDLTGSIDGVPYIYKAMMDGEANASVELTPNMAGPAFDVLARIQNTAPCRNA